MERDQELEELTAWLERARRREGAFVLVEGPAGIGKSSLLEACAERAGALGIATLRVRGDEVAMESSFAAVRELLWREVREAQFTGSSLLAEPVFRGDPSAAADADRAAAVLHGLYWVVADLADRAPLVLIVDDAHWLDPASGRFVSYLARRIQSLPVLLVAAVRLGETFGAIAALPELAATVLRPHALSEEATSAVVRRELGAPADEDLCRSCHEATGGNPFFLHELTAALKTEKSRPTAEMARHVRSLGAGAIAHNVLFRLVRLGDDCERLAQALAVLGPGAPLRHVASLASLDRDRAGVAADRMRAADLLAATATLAFVHPIVHEAISSEVRASRRAALHARAAALLSDDGAPPDRVAAHLLSAEPFGEGWVVDALRAAARRAIGQGAPEAAVSYLRRALNEPPAPDSRLEVLLELGRAESLLPIAQDCVALREALSLASGPVQRAEIAHEIADVLVSVAHNVSARVVLEDVLEQSAGLDAALVERLEAHLLGGGAPDLTATKRVLGRTDRHFARASRGEVGDPCMLAALAQTGAITGLPAAEVSELARRALRDERLLGLPPAYLGATGALTWSDQLQEAAAAQDVAIAEAQRRGSAPMFMQMSVFRAATAFRAGELDTAADHAQRAYGLARELSTSHFAGMVLIPVLLELGRVEDARAMVETLELDEPKLRLWQDVAVLAERGRVRVALEALEAGVADMLEADRRMVLAGCDLSVLSDWVHTAVPTLTALGRHEEARQIASRELEKAVAFGAPRRHGIALSVCGGLDGGADGLAQLRDAVALLENSPARLEHVRALVNLGAGLRMRGERGSARALLLEALDLAHRCGAVTVAERAREEVVATGARPRRASLRGPEALTPAESRTARMAAAGLSNREIAQALFVSAKTVESHLSHAYAKLRIGTRGELAAVLTGGDQTVRGSPAQSTTGEAPPWDDAAGAGPWVSADGDLVARDLPASPGVSGERERIAPRGNWPGGE